jgi:hypothetical protein
MSAPTCAHRRFARACNRAAQLIRTASNRLICLTIFAKTPGMDRNCPGQVAWLCGHDNQMAACGSHSAGIRNPSVAGVLFEVDPGILLGAAALNAPKESLSDA